MFKMRKNTEQPNLEQQQDNFTFKLDVSGYCPELLNVKMQGNEVIIYGEHYEQNQGGSWTGNGNWRNKHKYSTQLKMNPSIVNLFVE